ncbi:hypothetical protein KY342_06385 [Candidatus Woesearchaeota archaeon]|nr:hypothetical protein [Candidatus Woesearchaeota archaeon]
MTTTIYRQQNEEISNYVDNLLKQDKLNLDGAVNFNSFEPKDQQAILWVYKTKADQRELTSSIENKIACIEEVANLYRAQKCAFENVLRKENFDAVSEFLKTYSGRIAILTHHGTFITVGKYKSKGRLITMNRIHSPAFNYDKKRGYLTEDLKLGKSPYLQIINFYGYKGSPARALATNLHGADDDELEERDAHKTAIMMGLKTAFFLTQPRKLVKINSDK